MKISLFQSRHARSILAVATLLGISCAKAGKSDNAAESQNSINGSADARPIVGPARPSDSSTSILLSLNSSSTLSNVTAYVVGEINDHALSLVPETSGRYALNSMKPGRYDIVIEADKLSEVSNPPSTIAVGVRISGINIDGTRDTHIKSIELQPLGQIKGQLVLSSGSKPEGIAVEIPGTRLKALTAVDGSFTIERLPIGHHSLTARLQGYSDGLVETRYWESKTHQLPSLSLLSSDQAFGTGITYKGKGLSASSPNSVTLFLNRPLGTNKFRISQTSDFVGATWDYFRSSVDLNLPPGGERKVFVQYSQDEAILSPVFQVDLPLAL